MSPFVELVSNPAPPGQITREQMASVDMSRRREGMIPVWPGFIFLKYGFENSCNLAIKMKIDGRLNYERKRYSPWCGGKTAAGSHAQ
jgi:hypothetical protein